MEYESIIRKTYRTFFIPTTVATMGTALMSLLNILFAGLFYGRDGSFVVGLALPVILFSEILTYFFGTGGGIAVAIRQGKGDREEASSIFSAAVFFTLLAGVLAAVCGCLWLPEILTVLGVRTAAEQGAAGGYIRVLFLGMPFTLLGGVLNVFIRNDNHPEVAMTGNVIAVISDLVLLWVFIGRTRLPVYGIAMAVVISNVLCALFYAGYFLTGRSTLRFRFPVQGRFLAEIGKPGFAGSMIFLAQTILTIVINNVLMSVSGAPGIAAYGVVKYAITFIYAVYDSVNNAAQPMFSVYYGEKDARSLKLTAGTAGRFQAAGAVGLCILLWAAAPALSGIFSMDVNTAVRIIGCSCLFSAAVAFLNSFYRASGKAEFSLVLTILDNLIFPAVLVWILVYGYGLGENGVWLSLFLSEVLTLLVILIATKGNFLLIKESELPKDKVYQALILNEEANVVALNEEIETFCEKNRISMKKQYYILLCIEEIAVNIIKNGFKDGKKHYIDIRIAAGDEVFLNIRDDAVQFDPTEKKADTVAWAEEEDTSGLGIYLVKKVAKEFSYKRVIGFNNLHIVL